MHAHTYARNQVFSGVPADNSFVLRAVSIFAPTLSVLFLPYLQAQTVGLPVTLHPPNLRLMRSTLLPQASNVEAFSFPASSCPAEAAFMEEECVDTPKVPVALAMLQGGWRPQCEAVVWCGFVECCFGEEHQNVHRCALII